MAPCIQWPHREQQITVASEQMCMLSVSGVLQWISGKGGEKADFCEKIEEPGKNPYNVEKKIALVSSCGRL